MFILLAYLIYISCHIGSSFLLYHLLGLHMKVKDHVSRGFTYVDLHI